MTHILIIHEGSDISSNLRELVNTSDIRCVLKKTADEVRLSLERNVFDLCIVAELNSPSNFEKQIRLVKQINQTIPVLVLAQAGSADLEESACAAGADLFLSEPISLRSLLRIIELHDLNRGNSGQESPAQMHELNPTISSRSPVSALQILRDFSHVLGFSLDYKAFTHHFILKLRDQISFSRIGIFLEVEGSASFPANQQSSALKCIASFGLPPDLVDCFQLSREMGIGKAILGDPRIVCSYPNTDRAQLSPSIQKEFAILGCQIAIPISDRERAIGVAVLSGPVTGRQYNEEELQLLYLLMEELGLAIRNSRLHAEVASNGKLIGNVLKSMSSGALVFSDDMRVLYSNAAADRFLGRQAGHAEPVAWADLPKQIADPVHRAIEKGDLSDPFLVPSSESATIHRITMIPFAVEEELNLLPQPIMVVIEDFTKIEATKQTAMEDTRTQLIRLIAERFAHEIRNALVPLTTHMQLMEDRIERPEFRVSLKATLQKETSRIKRFSEQMLYLAQNSNPIGEHVDLIEVIRDGFDAAKSALGEISVNLEFLDKLNATCLVDGNREALQYAFEEIFTNSLQMNSSSDALSVQLQPEPDGQVTILIRDDGPGFSEEAIEHAIEPFYTSRNTGVGLGLSVAKKIFEEHLGSIELRQRSPSIDWDLSITLPTLIESPLKS